MASEEQLRLDLQRALKAKPQSSARSSARSAGQFSQRSLVAQKLQRRMREEARVREELQAKLAKSDQIMSSLQKQYATSLTSRAPPTPSTRTNSARSSARSAAAGGEVDGANVNEVLGMLDNWMRLRNYRAIDLFRRPDVNTSGAEAGDDLLSTDEFRVLFSKIEGLKITPAQVEELVRVLDIDRSGEIDVHELDVAMKQARRANIRRDPMHLIAQRLQENPYSKVLYLPTSRAIRKVQPESSTKLATTARPRQPTAQAGEKDAAGGTARSEGKDAK